jgi:UDP-glucose 4-epimerase
MGKILVTGGAGFVGSHIVDNFIKKGDEVIVFDNLTSGNKDNINSKAKFIKGDIRNIDELDIVMSGVDYVFHMAALVSVPLSIEQPELNEAINVLGTRNVLESAYKAGVKRVVIASSAAVYGDNPNLPLKESEELKPLSPYAEAKLSGEIMGREFTDKGLPVVALRFFNIYGPRQDPKSPYSGVISIFADRSKNNEDILIFGKGNQTRDFISVFDVVKANELALTIPPGNYNVATGTTITIRQLAEKIIGVSDSSSKIIFKEERAGDIKKSQADITKLKEQGFLPTIEFDEGLRDLINL